ncbi:hypothetical protein TNCV_37311 [Trichonephila clavipes]|nr:hypothetical protein TNCV_37311 [Trichonephila clavipes]
MHGRSSNGLVAGVSRVQMSAFEASPCRKDRCTLMLSRLNRPLYDMVRKILSSDITSTAIAEKLCPTWKPNLQRDSRCKKVPPQPQKEKKQTAWNT